MELKVKEFLLNNVDCRDYSEDGEADYSGRYMYGKQTHAVVVDDYDDVKHGVQDYINENSDEGEGETFDEVLSELEEIGVITDTWEEKGDIEVDGQFYNLNLRSDNLGRSYIFY